MALAGFSPSTVLEPSDFAALILAESTARGDAAAAQVTKWLEQLAETASDRSLLPFPELQLPSKVVEKKASTPAFKVGAPARALSGKLADKVSRPLLGPSKVEFDDPFGSDSEGDAFPPPTRDPLLSSLALLAHPKANTNPDPNPRWHTQRQTLTPTLTLTLVGTPKGKTKTLTLSLVGTPKSKPYPNHNPHRHTQRRT